MPIRNAIWKVGTKPQLLREARLSDEKTLEKMIIAEPGILSDEWMLIGEQVATAHGGFIDLLAMTPDGGLVVIELKRDRTPRDVVAQALDYASWVDGLGGAKVRSIHEKFSNGGSLEDSFLERFGTPLNDDTINEDQHQIVIVAASLDPGTERIVNYLNGRSVPINVLFFQVFEVDGHQLLSRTWLIDPGQTQINAAAGATRERQSWNGEFYVSFGDSESRSWDEAREYGFICGGGGTWYSNTLSALSEGDRVWVNVPRVGYVGVGRVTGARQAARDFLINDRPALSVLDKAGYHREFIDDPDRCEYFVPVQWLNTVPLSQAFSEIGLFGNQNTVCKPTTPKWRSTIERLEKVFPNPEA